MPGANEPPEKDIKLSPADNDIELDVPHGLIEGVPKVAPAKPDIAARSSVNVILVAVLGEFSLCVKVNSNSTVSPATIGPLKDLVSSGAADTVISSVAGSIVTILPSIVPVNSLVVLV